MARPVLAVLAVLAVLSGCGEPPKDPKDTKDLKDTQQAPKDPGVGRVVVDWQRWRNPPTRIAIGIGGVAAGPAEGPLVPHLFLGPERAEDAHWFARTYAPFRLRMAHGELAFQGRGRVRPGAVERRMILEWARRVAAELAGGSSAYGLALSWHRGVSVGSCESVTVFLTGEVRGQSCAWGEDEVRGRLHTAAAGRVYGWFDSLKAFQSSQQPGESGEAEASRLVFAGQGRQAPDAKDRAALESFAAALFRELSAKRRGGAPIPPEGVPAGPELLLPAESLRASPPLARLAPKVPPPLPRPPRTTVSSGNRRPAEPPPQP